MADALTLFPAPEAELDALDGLLAWIDAEMEDRGTAEPLYPPERQCATALTFTTALRAERDAMAADVANLMASLAGEVEEVEKLRAERDDLRAQRNHANGVTDAAVEEIERLRATMAEWQSSQGLRYIGRDGKPVLARDLEARTDAAEARVAELWQALIGMAQSLELSNITYHRERERANEAEARALAAEAAQVLRGGEWVVVGRKAYKLRDLSDAAYRMVKDMGSNNPGFDMPAWFFSGSPFGVQIVGLGCEAHEIPSDFRPEYLPRLEKAWASRASIFDRYAAGDDGVDLVRAAEAAALERAAHAASDALLTCLHDDMAYFVAERIVPAIIGVGTPAARTALDAVIAEAQMEGKCAALGDLRDPLTIYISMFSGIIAKPSVSDIIQIYGEDVLRSALAASVEGGDA